MPNRVESEPPPSADVIPLFGPTRRAPQPREAAVTPEEIAEYRQMRPLLLKMIEQWGQVTSPCGGCPVANQIINGR